MGRHALWLLSPLLVAGTWLAGHVLTYHVAAPGAADSLAAGHGHLGSVPLCAATAMTLVLAALTVRPALVLGYELARRFAAAHVPRPSACAPAPPAPVWLAPDLARPSVLATGHGGRAPPASAVAHA
jgi:hypothetical protein